MVYLFIILYL